MCKVFSTESNTAFFHAIRPAREPPIVACNDLRICMCCNQDQVTVFYLQSRGAITDNTVFDKSAT